MEAMKSSFPEDCLEKHLASFTNYVDKICGGLESLGLNSSACSQSQRSVGPCLCVWVCLPVPVCACPVSVPTNPCACGVPNPTDPANPTNPTLLQGSRETK